MHPSQGAVKADPVPLLAQLPGPQPHNRGITPRAAYTHLLKAALRRKLARLVAEELRRQAAEGDRG